MNNKELSKAEIREARKIAKLRKQKQKELRLLEKERAKERKRKIKADKKIAAQHAKRAKIQHERTKKIEKEKRIEIKRAAKLKRVQEKQARRIKRAEEKKINKERKQQEKLVKNEHGKVEQFRVKQEIVTKKVKRDHRNQQIQAERKVLEAKRKRDAIAISQLKANSDRELEKERKRLYKEEYRRRLYERYLKRKQHNALMKKQYETELFIAQKRKEELKRIARAQKLAKKALFTKTYEEEQKLLFLKKQEAKRIKYIQKLERRKLALQRKKEFKLLREEELHELYAKKMARKAALKARRLARRLARIERRKRRDEAIRKYREEFTGYVHLPKWINCFVTWSFVIFGLLFVTLITLILINIGRAEPMFDITKTNGSVTLFGAIVIAVAGACTLLAIAAMILHLLDRKSREALAARRLLIRTKNAVHGYNEAIREIKKLTDYCFTLQRKIKHKDKKIHQLHNQLNQNYVRTNVALKLQSRITSLEHEVRRDEKAILALKARIKRLHERPTLQEKLEFREALALQKHHEHTLRMKRKEHRRQQRDIARLGRENPIFIPQPEPKNLTSQQKMQWHVDQTMAEAKFNRALVDISNRVCKRKTDEVKSARKGLTLAKTNYTASVKKYALLLKQQAVAEAKLKHLSKEQRRAELKARKEVARKAKAFKKAERHALKIEAKRVKEIKRAERLRERQEDQKKRTAKRLALKKAREDKKKRQHKNKK